jgi:acetolactate synthase I/II/III large subunit
LIRIDIDRTLFGLLPRKGIFLDGDSDHLLQALLMRMDASPANRGGKERARTAREAAFKELSPAMQRQVEFLNMVRDTLPDAVIVGDSTKPVYAGNLFFEAARSVSWFNSATGFGTLGYALPAAIGAKLAAPERPVICLAGDGGLQFTLAELGSAIDAGASIIVLVWNNRGYGEIKSYFEDRGIAPIGVDATPPDFVAVARAYGWAAERLADRGSLPDLLRAAATRAVPTLIEIDERIAEGR